MEFKRFQFEASGSSGMRTENFKNKTNKLVLDLRGKC